MDLETENRIAAILMKEAAELRRQAARDGIDAYLHPPNVRGRPNSRFLTATVLGVQQANRAVEVNEMWKARQKEKEMDDRVRKYEQKRANNVIHESQKNANVRFDDYERKHSSLCSSSKSPSEDELKDKEIEEFLHSRAKRGRGAVGSRMDETGPYLPEVSKGKDVDDIGYDEWWDNRAVLGPKRPHSLRAKSSSDSDCSERREKRVKRDCSRKKHRSKEKSKDKKKKREKKRSKHHK
ncbi:NKAP family protein UM04995 [Lactuca sativa]|uniref:Uncharacterized protein n=1 Tax=Lactuca sativa TaxID=4236 RepID=A0A9R1V1L6_LACSA|nr:NKAP family protein UM04995 [Lactuca sativa]KAJ0196658.1 hypothetical protein LSAT_V11C700374980 [Lactuca sativa]